MSAQQSHSEISESFNAALDETARDLNRTPATEMLAEPVVTVQPPTIQLPRLETEPLAAQSPGCSAALALDVQRAANDTVEAESAPHTNPGISAAVLAAVTGAASVLHGESVIWVDAAELDMDVTRWVRRRDATRTKKIIADFRARFREAKCFDAHAVRARPIQVKGVWTLKIMDGRCRAVAAREAGFKVPVVVIEIADDVAALDWGIAANICANLNNAEKERAVELRMKEPGSPWPGRTLKWLADDLGISAHTVKRIAEDKGLRFATQVQSRPSAKFPDGQMFPRKVALADAQEPKPLVASDGEALTCTAKIGWDGIPSEHAYEKVTARPMIDTTTGKPFTELTIQIDLRPLTAEIVADGGKAAWLPSGAPKFTVKGHTLFITVPADQTRPAPPHVVLADQNAPPGDNALGNGQPPVEASTLPADTAPVQTTEAP